VSTVDPTADRPTAGEPMAVPAARARVAGSAAIQPREIANMALAEALFLRRYATR
jgi:hypothetical protein